MNSEILHTSNFLNGLFTENDFKFLTNSENEIEDIKNRIIYQEVRRDTIVEYINNLNEIIANSELDFTQKELLSSGTRIFEESNNSINLLYNLKRTLNELIQSTVDLLISIETTKKNKEFYSDIISSIEEKIKNFSDLKNTTLKEIDLINNNYISFIMLEKNKEYTKMIDPTTKVLKSYAIDEINKNKKSKKKIYDKKINIPDNKDLVITEDYVYLPYKCSEINNYLKKYPDSYSSAEDVIKKEFTFSRKYYTKHSVLARFRETYSLIRDREGKSIPEALKYAFELMFKYELNPAIIAACKKESDLDEYLECLDTNTLSEFKRFRIKFEINPL